LKEEINQISSSIHLYKLPKSGEWKDDDIPKPVGRYFIDLDDTRIADIPLYYDGKALINPHNDGLWTSFKNMLTKLFFIAKEHGGSW
jgi:serine-type D-Ala-D-Ala carboxypeptidase (penicillin-binding protein 5/6)